MNGDSVVQKNPVALEFINSSDVILDAETGRVFGQLRPQSQKICEVLHRDLTVQLYAESSSSYMEATSERRLGSERNARVNNSAPQPSLHAILYGPKALFEDTGTFVAKCKFYLQHPRHCKLNVEYRNPHCLSPASGLVPNTYAIEKLLDRPSHSVIDLHTDPIDLFADALEQEALVDTDPPHGLSTELYKHQKQALTFMLQREGGWALNQDQKDIWKREQDQIGRVSYINIVSGHKQRTPPMEFRGGLLIDAPGLGKSLSIISLIMSNSENGMPSNSEKSGSTTTLLIVPNTCALSCPPSTARVDC